MNVLHIVQSLHVSGRSRLIGDLCRGLPPLGFVSTVVSLTDAAPQMRGGLDVVCLGKPAGVDLRTLLRLFRLVGERRPRVIHTHGRGAVPYAAAVRIVRPGLRWIHTVHRADGDPVAAHASLRRLLLRKVDRVVGVSDAARGEFARRNAFPAARTAVIHNGIDVARFASRRARQPRLEAPVVGMVANASPDKDPVTLLQAFAGVRKAFPAARLTMAGGGPMAADVARRAQDLGLAGAVEFVGFCDDVPRLLASLDVFVLATRTEGMGLAVLEAMAAGVPVVASAVGGIPEIVTDGVTGQLVGVGDADALRDAVLRALRDRAWSGRLARAAAAMVNERFSIRRMCARYTELYERP